MDGKVQNIISAPNYQKIYKDLIQQKFPDKFDLCKSLLQKESFCTLDVISLNKIIFETRDKDTESFDQKHRCYDEKSIFKILQHQKRLNLNNSQIASIYKLSRNTIAKWKKLYYMKI